MLDPRPMDAPLLQKMGARTSLATGAISKGTSRETVLKRTNRRRRSWLKRALLKPKTVEMKTRRHRRLPLLLGPPTSILDVPFPKKTSCISSKWRQAWSLVIRRTRIFKEVHPRGLGAHLKTQERVCV